MSVTALAVSCGKSGSSSSSSDDGGTAGKSTGGASTAGSKSAGASGSSGTSFGGTSGATGSGGSGATAGTAGGGNAAGVGGTAGNAGTSATAGVSGTTSPAGGASGAGGEGGGGAGGEAPVMENPPGGQITISNIGYNDGNQTTQTSAAFWRASVPSNAPNPCEVRTYGSCTVETCPSTPPDPPPPPTTAAPGAGTVSLTATAVSYAKTLGPNAGYGAYGSDVDNTVRFTGGESVSISATGGEIPAFSASMAMPVPLVITNELPARDTNGGIPLDVEEDLVLDFTGGMPGVVVQVQGLTGQSGGPTQSTLSCFFESEPGTLTIPTGALTPLGPRAIVVFFTLRRSTLVAGDYNVLLVFGKDVDAGDGLPTRFLGVP